MTNLDNIIDAIIDSAKARAAAILQEAKRQYDEETEKAHAKAKLRAEEIESEAQKEYARIKRTAQAQTEAKNRMEILIKKREAVDEVIAAATEKIKELDPKSYVKKLEGLICRHAKDKGAGEILFDDAEFDALKGALMPVLNSHNLTPVKAGRIGSGFILRFGAVEENCTIPALVRAKRDELSDTIINMLF